LVAPRCWGSSGSSKLPNHSAAGPESRWVHVDAFQGTKRWAGAGFLLFREIVRRDSSCPRRTFRARLVVVTTRRPQIQSRASSPSAEAEARKGVPGPHAKVRHGAKIDCPTSTAEATSLTMSPPTRRANRSVSAPFAPSNPWALLARQVEAGHRVLRFGSAPMRECARVLSCPTCARTARRRDSA
jgi:hypothetical protein